MVFVGGVKEGISEEMLTGLVRQMEEDRQGEAGKPAPTFTWIEVRRGTTVLAQRQPTTNTAQFDCRGDASGGWKFIRAGAPIQTQPYLGFPLLSLPETVTMTGTILAPHLVRAPSPTPWTQEFISTTALLTYTTHLISGSVRPCAGGSLQASDPGARVMQRYAVKQSSSHFYIDQQVVDTTPAADIVTFQMQRQPVQVDVTGGTWKEVRAGDAHGIFWTGSPYRDMQGIAWAGDVSVLVVEKGDTVITLLGTVAPASFSGAIGDQGATEELLLAVMKGMH
jgi:hypothetical protein